MAAKERKQHGRGEEGAKGDKVVVRRFRTVNRGLLALGLVTTAVALFIAPVTVRSLCILLSRRQRLQARGRRAQYRDGAV